MPDRNDERREWRDLPIAADSDSSFGNGSDEGWTYISYGERGEDVAFEISDNLEEAVEIYQSMKEDGFATKLFQAHELEVVTENSRH